MTIKYKTKKRGRPIKYNGFEATLGNSKLPITTAIFNMTTASECPSDKLGLCAACIEGKNWCYARKAENTYPTVKPYRTRQAAYWDACSVLDFVHDILAATKKLRRPINALRFNESGDFRTQDDVTKADAIAAHLSDYGITTYMYTSRSDLDFSNVRYLKIQGSGFHKQGLAGTFKIVQTEAEVPENYGTCPGDCTACKRCQVFGLNTAVILH
jgi:hypothetical protein